MSIYPSLTGKQILKALKKAGFDIKRIKGSHYFMEHPDGRVTVVPVHGKEIIGPGLMNKILHDCELSRDKFLKLL